MSRRGWQITKGVESNIHRLDDKEVYLARAFATIHESVADFIKGNKLSGRNNYVIVETNYPLKDQEICLCAVVEVAEIVMNKYIKVLVELHMMMQEEHAGTKLA